MKVVYENTAKGITGLLAREGMSFAMDVANEGFGSVCLDAKKS
jgi:hypothetical protein